MKIEFESIKIELKYKTEEYLRLRTEYESYKKESEIKIKNLEDELYKAKLEKDDWKRKHDEVKEKHNRLKREIEKDLQDQWNTQFNEIKLRINFGFKRCFITKLKFIKSKSKYEN